MANALVIAVDFASLLATAGAGGANGESGGEPNSDRVRALLSSIGWVLLIIIAAVVLVVLALSLKKRFTGDDHDPHNMAISGFTVGDLRRMRDSGDINDEEYERARERIVTAAKKLLAEETEREGNPDRPPPDAPHTKNLDLIRDAES